MAYIQVEHINSLFVKLTTIRQNGWQGPNSAFMNFVMYPINFGIIYKMAEIFIDLDLIDLGNENSLSIFYSLCDMEVLIEHSFSELFECPRDI